MCRMVGSHSHALTHTYERKMRGAEEDCRRQGIAFIPIAVESFGGSHGAAEAEVRKLGAALGEAVHHLWGHLFVFTVSLYS